MKCRNIQTEGATEANVGADKQLSYMKPVSYTHLDFAPGEALTATALHFADGSAVDLREGCLLYTSRCV